MPAALPKQIGNILVALGRFRPMQEHFAVIGDGIGVGPVFQQQRDFFLMPAKALPWRGAP